MGDCSPDENKETYEYLKDGNFHACDSSVSNDVDERRYGLVGLCRELYTTKGDTWAKVDIIQEYEKKITKIRNR